jgi:thymidylate synthase (FAD)
MRLIKSSVEIIPQDSGLLNGYKHIEKAARNCYKSEDKITDTSYKQMMDILSNKGHLSPLEHCAIYLIMD